MKLFYTLLFFTLLLCSCKKDRPAKIPIEIYSEEDFARKVKIVDTFCISESERAKKDIKNGRLVLNTIYLHSDFFFYLNGEMPFDKCIEQELAKYGIEADTNIVLPSCIVMPHEGYLRDDCYRKIMREEIEKKFGKNIFDSIVTILEKKYVLSHPDTLFTMLNRDMPPYDDKYAPDPAYDYIAKKKLDLHKAFKFPKGYASTKENSGCRVNVEFILMKNGSISDLRIETEFDNAANTRFSSYFQSQIKRFITETRWVHPTHGGVVANCQLSLYFYLKPSEI